MKNRIVRILSIMLVVSMAFLCSCGATTQDNENEPEKPAKEETVPKETENKPEEKAEEVSDDEPEPAPGTTLTICVDENYNQVYSSIFAEYSSLYPDVELRYELIPNDQNERETVLNRLRTALMAGKGADLFLLTNTDEFFENTEMNMSNGVFCDLLPLFDEADISMDDFIESVMKAGQKDGKQYIVPIRYNLGLFLTNDETRSIIGEDNFGDTLSLSNGIRALSAIPDVGTKVGSAFGSAQTPKMLAEMFMPYFTGDPNPVNYSDFTSSFDTDFAKTVLENIGKSNFAMDLRNKDWDTVYTEEEFTEFIKSDKYFVFSNNLEYTLYEAAIADQLGGDVNVDYVPMQNGGLCAIVNRIAGVRANSANKENAVNMIKILLSEERQSFMYDHGGSMDGVWPVRKDCLAPFIQSVIIKGRSPLSIYFHSMIFEDTLSSELVDRFVEIENSITEARISPPWEAAVMVYNYNNGKTDFDTMMKNTQGYWYEHLWDAS